jgi:hypothetical protein
MTVARRAVGATRQRTSRARSAATRRIAARPTRTRGSIARGREWRRSCASSVIEAHASISVPSTEKCSLDNRRLTRGWARTAVRNLAAISPASTRSRFFEKVEWSHTGSSTPIPTNQRNSRSNSNRSMSWRSERTERGVFSFTARGEGWVYLLRLAAFTLIIVAILRKNLRTNGH